ncbi:hypothetical protein SG34_025480 [Thalassomonas viridans]|uniref:Uncharacterized protein n=1 Tax=Thalassomonas viridans TaxID=137584 RepID=A0AAE9Z3N0_9GAMM|nr:hypothetical protein [Thalassomonas viridans]WDE04643.1 hypothetical protein SG34_025480 [Thalassomonas viridans]
MNGTAKNLTPIVIDLTQPLTSGRVETENLLQVQAKNRLDNLLNKFIKNIEIQPEHINKNSWAREFDTQRFNNTIFISGQRGAGKTTFLRSVLLEKFNNETDGILPVAFVDPTLVETHQHILVDIIAKFKQLVSEQLSCCGDEDKHKQFTEKLEALAEGLKLLGNNNKPTDPDASWFLNKALKHAVGGQTLEAKLHELIDTVAEILKQKLFIIAIDDVDTDTSKAYEVLELIRRYLTHPKLAVIISGDPLLYSHIVQGQKIKELGSNHQRFKGAEQYEKNTTKLVEHLEQQYLAKVLPIEQRIELKNLNDLLIAAKAGRQPSIKIKKGTSTPIEIGTHITTTLEDNVNLNEKHLASYIQFMLTQPVRSILQILKSTLEQNYSSNHEALKISFINSYVGILRKEEINLEALMSGTLHPNAIGLALFNLCNKYGELETGFYARPDSNDESYNVSQVFLSTVISSYLSKEPQLSIGRAFQLMLTAGAACNVYMNNVVDNLKQGRTSDDYVNYIGLNRNQNMFSLAAHFSPFVWENKNIKKISSGILRIPRRKPSNFSDDVFSKLLNDVFNRDEELKKNTQGQDTNIQPLRFSSIANLEKSHNSSDVNILEYIAAKTVLISSHSMMTKNEGRDYVSGYCLLASLAELLISEKISNKISQLSSIQTFGSPAFVNIQGEGDEVLPEEIGFTTSNTSNNHDDELIKLLKTWKSNNDKGKFSSLLIGKVWARIMYTLANISEKVAKEKVSYDDNKHDALLGTVFSRFIWGIINATLIEEVRYGVENNSNLIKKFQNSKNVTTSPAELTRNLKFAIAELTPSSISTGSRLSDLISQTRNTLEDNFKKTLPLTFSLISCPLVWPYIGVYIDNSGSSKSDLFDLIKQVVADFKDFTTDENSPDNQKFLEAQKFISRLPIMGCFPSNIEKDK